MNFLILSLIVGLIFAEDNLFDETDSNDEDVCVVDVDPGPCTIDRLPMTNILPTPRIKPAVFFPSEKSNRNVYFSSLVSRTELSNRIGHETVHLTSSNAYSDGEV